MPTSASRCRDAVLAAEALDAALARGAGPLQPVALPRLPARHVVVVVVVAEAVAVEVCRR
jgi:hypothetical protein